MLPILPKQYLASCTSCGIRSNLDLVLIWSNTPCMSGAVFTKNAFKAAPVLVCQDLLKKQQAQGIIINAGNANAVTGKQGMDDAIKMSSSLVKPVYVMSTGVIGKNLPINKVMNGIQVLNKQLESDDTTVKQIAQAIMTTDTVPKFKTLNFTTSDGKECVLTGIAKGAGMVHPNMATMLGCILTDAKLPSQSYLQSLLQKAAKQSFNAISVDGDTSTNDTVLALSNNQVELSKSDLPQFEELFFEICDDLSTSIVKDGEGATKLIYLTVKGLESDDLAYNVARFVSRSPLVKTAIFGRDANWGRLFSSAGSSPELMNKTFTNTENMSCEFESEFGNVQVFKESPLAFDEDLAKKILSSDIIKIKMTLGKGNGQATVKTCDFTPEYVHVNASYRS